MPYITNMLFTHLSALVPAPSRNVYGIFIPMIDLHCYMLHNDIDVVGLQETLDRDGTLCLFVIGRNLLSQQVSVRKNTCVLLPVELV